MTDQPGRFAGRTAGRTEDEATEAMLDQLAKAHPAESRAADIVAAECLLNRFRYTAGLGWLEWDGCRWDPAEEADERVAHAVRVFMDTKERDYRVRQAAGQTRLAAVIGAVLDRLGEDEAGKLRMLKKDHEIVDEHGTEAEATEYNAAFRETQTSKQQADMWLNLLSNAKIKSITSLCRRSDGILTRTTDFDQLHDLLNCTNGVVDLRTGALHEHDPGRLITKVAAGQYVPGAVSPLWETAKAAIHPDALTWFQKRIGQAFTGHTPNEDSIVVSAGGGENGKTAVLSAALRAAGDYGRLISHKVLITAPGQHSTELMDLRGLRFALLEETPEEGRLDTQQLKTTIGATYITARHMRQNDVTFKTTHSLFINTNFLPQVDTTDHGTWRRLLAMPWPFTFRKPWEECTEPHHRPGDPTLKKRLETDSDAMSAVIAWAVAGAVAYYADQETDANRAPECVEQATLTWRSSSDVGLQFATERLVAAADYFITAEAMFAEFSEFLTAEGKRAWSKQTLNTRLPESLRAAGIVVDRTPAKSGKVSARMAQSHAPNQLSDSWAPTQSTHVNISPGRTARIWLGVRFRTHAERGQPLAEAV